MIPSPAALTVHFTQVDDVTDGTEEITLGPFYVNNAHQENGLLSWEDSNGDLSFRQSTATPIDGGDHVDLDISTGSTYRFRAVNPYDAVILAPRAGIPQPVAAIRAALLSGGQLAQELDAVVAGDNTVATLMLETSVGTYVRFSGDWQLLSADSESLEDMALIPVGPGAVDIWDAGEATRSTVSVFDLPNVTSRNGEDYVQEPSGKAPDALPIAASGLAIPSIRDTDDLPLAIRFGTTHPDSRWYITKRASALNASAMIPADWQPGVVRPFVEPAAN